MADFAIRGMFPVHKRVDHRVLEMGPTPPRHEGIGIARPPLRRQERGCGLGQSSLHVDHGSILVEHANLDGRPHVIRLRHRCSLEVLWQATADRQTEHAADRCKSHAPLKPEECERDE
jgi:hypothetical protein